MVTHGFKRFAFLPAFAASLLLPAVVSAQEYEITDLGATGHTNVGYSINQLGDAVGFSRDPTWSDIEGCPHAEVDTLYGNFQGDPFDQDSERLIIVGRRPT